MCLLAAVLAVAVTRPRFVPESAVAVPAAALLVAITMLIASGVAQATNRSVPARAAEQNLTQVVVRPGQSLWSLAQSADPNADTRMVVQQIIELNGLASDTVQAGQQLYMSYGCSGCHGGTGGGGMCPPLTNDICVYGGDDDTLFRLVTYGSQELRSKGYTRTGQENVVGDMPAMGQIVKTDDDLWKILAFVRANYHGAPECKFGCGAK